MTKQPITFDDIVSIPRPILFTKPNCSKCEWIKGKISFNPSTYHSLDLAHLDGNNADAMGTLAYYSLVTIAEKNLPILLTKDLEVVVDINRIAELLGFSLTEGFLQNTGTTSNSPVCEPVCDDDTCHL